jgi:hypothetical protein
VLPGQRYAHALALAARAARRRGRARAERAAAEDAVARRLHTLLARDHPRRRRPGTFWLGGAGLGSLYPSATAWGRSLVDELAALGLRGVVVIGFSRFATCAPGPGPGRRPGRRRAGGRGGADAPA